jgi:hypothetical protein
MEVRLELILDVPKEIRREGAEWRHLWTLNSGVVFKHGNALNVINFRILIENAIKYTQQNAQTFQYTIFYIKHYTSNIFRSVIEYVLEGNTQKIMYKAKIKIKLG